MACCNFVFDTIVTRLDVPNFVIQNPKKLQIDVLFNQKNVIITDSRINVDEFKSDVGTEFTVEPKQLRESLQQCGMPVSVKYNGHLLGTGHISFPQSMVDNIDEAMTEWLHSDSCRFSLNGNDVGRLDLLCRLVIKCDNQPKPEKSECHRNVDKSINPQDILFVMGGSERCPSPCDPCLDAWTAEDGEEQLQLDLKRYLRSNAGIKSHAETLIHNPAGNAICCEIKKMAKDCEQAIDSIFKRPDEAEPIKPPCRGPAELINPCSGPCRYSQSKIQSKTPAVPDLPCLPVQRDGSDDYHYPGLKSLPITNIYTPCTQNKPLRFCPVCLTNMSWMPKLAACPKCGVKPIPVIEERRPKDRQVEQILLDCLGKPKETIHDYCNDILAKAFEKEALADEKQQRKCQCTCKYGKLCAYCRVCELCADFYQPDTKQESKAPTIVLSSSDDLCQNESAKSVEDARPFLASVFSELHFIYDIKDANPLEREIASSGKKVKPPKIKESHKDDKEKNLTQQSIAARALTNPVKQQRSDNSKLRKLRIQHRSIIPRRHGWKWYSTPEARKYGWRPGAVLKPMKKLMNFFLQHPPEDNAKKCGKQNKNEKEMCDQPILSMCKKNGEIIITLRAVNNAHMEMKPIIFKVVKSDLAVALREIKRKLKDRGFRKCVCHNTLMMCVCRDNVEKKHLEYAVQKECKRRGMENCADHLVLTDTSESDTEFDFEVTPPVGMSSPPCLLKPSTVNHSTQTVKKDKANVQPKYPIQLGPYWRACDCAAGDRYTGTAFGAPGEAVFEDGVFGHRGGGPHGPPAAPGGKAKPEGIWGSKPGGPMRGGGRGGGGAGGAGAGVAHGGKSFPGAKKQPGAGGKSEPIPVKMTKRQMKAVAAAAEAENVAIQNEMAARKEGIDMMKYLKKKGVFIKARPVVGTDGLSDAQRKRIALRQMPIPPLESLPRRGRGFDPCANQCFNPCSAHYCYPRSYFC